jgi:hypothetical protein
VHTFSILLLSVLIVFFLILFIVINRIFGVIRVLVSIKR